MEFRHPSAIQQELSRHLNLRHRLEEVLKDPLLPPDGAVVAEQSKLFSLGVIAALEWALCNRHEIEPGDSNDVAPDVP